MRPNAFRVVRVSAGAGGYDVVVGQGAVEELPDLLAEHAPAYRYAVVSDSRVAALHGERIRARCAESGLRVDLFSFPEGEASKTRGQWIELTDTLLEAGCGRDTVVVAVGGGVTTDLGGFVAATFLRGVPVVQVPTSYLAMIDASVGGKTGVDVPAGKNLVGAFHPPSLVVADPDVLATLPREERAQGLVEALKHGAVLDAAYFERLEQLMPQLLESDPAVAGEAVGRSVELKAAVVEADEREGGYRQVLNFGHTLGHALEAASDYEVGHGTAVAEGMLLEAEVGERIGVTEDGTREHLEAGLGALGLPPLPRLDPERVQRYLLTDKKARDGQPRYVLLGRIGVPHPGEGWSRAVPTELVSEVLATRLG
ncbi:MAG: 3-dehydroquinate synthase [Gemmatimonadota bacterium]|nr:3-dehydroquinate synthase [Gemmatimonadota bacterium]